MLLWELLSLFDKNGLFVSMGRVCQICSFRVATSQSFSVRVLSLRTLTPAFVCINVLRPDLVDLALLLNE